MTRPVVPPPITDTVAPLGPNARAMLDKTPCAYCHHERGGHHEGVGVCCVTLECPCRDYAVPSCRCGKRECFFCRFDSRGEQHVSRQPSPRPTVTTRELQAVLRETLLVLREQGVPLTDKQIEDRVGNGVMKILGLFEINYVGGTP